MRGDTIETYKKMSGLDDVNSCQFLTRPNMNSVRGDSLEVHKKRFRKIIRKEVFSQRVIDQWNGLPVEVVKAKTLSSLKNSLDKYWMRYRH